MSRMASASKETWRERSAATRRARSERQILDAACDLFLDMGYHQVTVEAIAVRAGVGPATVYQRFRSKAVLAAAVFSERLGDLSTPAARDAETMVLEDALQCHLERLAEGYNRHRPLGHAMFEALSRTDGPPTDANDPRLLFPLSRPLATILRAARQRGELDAGIDVEDVAGSLTSFLLLRVQSRRESSFASASFVARAATRGLLAARFGSSTSASQAAPPGRRQRVVTGACHDST